MTYKATFWGDEADYVLGHVTKGDQIALTGYANQIIEAAKGPYLEILNCELNYIEPLVRIPVEGIKSLRKKEVDTNGTVS